MADLATDENDAAGLLILLTVELSMVFPPFMDFDGSVVESKLVDAVPELGGQADKRRHQLILRGPMSPKVSLNSYSWNVVKSPYLLSASILAPVLWLVRTSGTVGLWKC